MSNSHNATYLENRVRTSSQPQLHLMLIEGALRFGHQARQMWEDLSKLVLVDQLLDRMVDIVEELVHSTTKGKTEVSKQLEEQYAYLFRELVVCRMERNLAKLDSCLKLLEYQRETWKMACEWAQSSAGAPVVTPMPHMPLSNSGGLSIEA